MDLEQAANTHRDWKVKFRLAITSKSRMDASAIGVDNCCELGRWLHGEAKQRLGRFKSYADCVGKHAAFHHEAGKVAQAINAGRYADASAMLEGTTPYAAASSAVGSALLALRKETAAAT